MTFSISTVKLINILFIAAGAALLILNKANPKRPTLK